MTIFGFGSDLFSVFTHPLLLLLAGAGASWMFIFRPSLRTIPLGAIAFTASLAIEYYLVPLGLGYELLIAAPLVEESMKFLLNLKRNFAGGLSIGLGFSIIENTSYFVMFHGTPYFLEAITVRSFSDVAMHSFNAGLSTFSWKGIGKLRFGLPAAIGIHAAFNFCALEFASGVTMYISVLLWTTLLISCLVLLRRRSSSGGSYSDFTPAPSD